MKFKIIPVILLATVFTALLLSRIENPPPPSPSLYPGTPSPAPQAFFSLELEGRNYRLDIVPLNFTAVKLISNFNEKKTSANIVSENKCRIAVNGGFYDTQNMPLGFYDNNDEFTRTIPHENTLFNGYFAVTGPESIYIGNRVPEKYLAAFQTGPLITPYTKLKLLTDEYARRMLIGQYGQKFMLLSVSEIDNLFSGPLLDDLPEIFQKSQTLSGFPQFTTLLNLDGGSASVLYSENKFIADELTPVGTVICFQ